ncbi:hypothetical protein GALMADRAFT_132602 [Galerina marginata CBS 339.88]|uniref:Uncharacterized protein n=1 Tax=Galerina marginata (strain CBS 339.88) TaxID=685588 RepID=A0A067TS59_GALM3|nr:hypothetical protein GALMADRAFT_132602 [Galerina marginata CBS 339.88]
MAKLFFIVSIIAIFASPFVVASPLNLPAAAVPGRDNLQFEREDAQFLRPRRRTELEGRDGLQYLEREDTQFLKPHRRDEVTKRDGIKYLEREDTAFLRP